MPGYAPVHSLVGFGPVNDIFTPDTVQRFTVGQVIDAVDPYFGYGRFAYYKCAASQAVAPGRLVTVVDETGLTVDLASTANLGYPILVARQNFTSSATAQWGWFQFEGICPIQVNASVAAGVAIGIGTAGTATTNSAGKQLLGVKVLRASTFTLTKVGLPAPVGPQLSTVLGVTNVDGLFIGLAVSGTGVPASTTISSIDPSGRYITLNNSLTTIPNGQTITFTYTGFVLAHLNTPQGQGAIT